MTLYNKQIIKVLIRLSVWAGWSALFCLQTPKDRFSCIEDQFIWTKNLINCSSLVSSYTGKVYSKTCVKQPLSKRPKIGFQDQLSLNAGQKYYRMLQGEHSEILSTFIKLPFVIKVFVLSIFEWPFYTGLTVYSNSHFSLTFVTVT